MISNEYLNGLNDAWNLSRELFRMESRDILSLYRDCRNWWDVVENYSAEEAVKIYDDYKNKMIHFGDELVYEPTNSRCIVIAINNRSRVNHIEMRVMFANGDVECYDIEEEKFYKTGRNFAETINNLLDNIK